MSLPSTVADVVARLQEIDDALPAGDGVAVFNRMYLTVTERIGLILAEDTDSPLFRDVATMSDLDVRFANLWLAAYDADLAAARWRRAWRPLFEARAGGRLPVQYAIAGMNSHIEHDLPLAVVGTCRARDLEPDDLHLDYETVNDVLAQVESGSGAPSSTRWGARSTTGSAPPSTWSAPGRSTRRATCRGSPRRPSGRSAGRACCTGGSSTAWPTPSAWRHGRCWCRRSDRRDALS